MPSEYLIKRKVLIKNFNVQKGCKSKIRHSTLEFAKSDLKRLKSSGKFIDDKLPIVFYKCPVCSGWHYGHLQERFW
jgi:hypothetical protein